MPVRKVVRPTGRGKRGRFPSRKMGRSISWESLLERDGVLYLEMSPAVVRYEEQPANIYYEHEGQIRHYIPDFEAVLSSGEIIHIEVKPSYKLVQPELARKYASIKKHYAEIGMRFLILTEKELQVEPFLSNLNRLFQHLPRDFDAPLDEHIKSLDLLPARTITGAAAVCGSEQIVYRLIAAGHLQCDLTKPLSGSTEIQRNGKDARDESIFH
jgi:hypothetical protein